MTFSFKYICTLANIHNSIPFLVLFMTTLGSIFFTNVFTNVAHVCMCVCMRVCVCVCERERERERERKREREREQEEREKKRNRGKERKRICCMYVCAYGRQTRV